MSVLESMRSAQFVVDAKDQHTGVFLSAEAWESLLHWLEMLEDLALAKRALLQLQAAGGRPADAGWLEWSKVKDEWDDV